VKGRTFNSGSKRSDQDAVEQLDIYGELHRYIQCLFAGKDSRWKRSMSTRSRTPRQHKYGIARFWRGMFDLITVRYPPVLSPGPFHFFVSSAS